MKITSLKKRQDFLDIAKYGQKAVSKGIVVQTKENTKNSKQINIGFTATKKLGNAVIRNRIKRKLRAVASLIINENAKQNYDYVIIGRKAALDREFNDLVKDLKYALHATSTHK